MEETILPLIRKYNVPGPRYTSYPTVPHWQKSPPSNQSWIHSIEQTYILQGKSEGICLYIHLPYCESLCTYCGCNTRITVNHAVEVPYIEALCKEWNMLVEVLGEKPLVKEIHLGGGTPTFFSPQNLGILIEHIQANSLQHENFEYSFEGHPNNTTFDHLQRLAELGFKRVSFGVQDVDSKVQETIHRIQPSENVSNVIQWARKLGYESINIDLVYGLPFQTVETVQQTMNEVFEWKPDRIAFYSYAHVPWLKPGQRKYTEMDLPSGEEKRALYERGRHLLEENGYVEIGMDHFALKSDALYTAFQEGKLHRNFMGYTTTNSSLLLGLGVSAISDAWTAFAQNEKTVEGYLTKINSGNWAYFKGHSLTSEEQNLRRHITQLMCHFKTEWSFGDSIEKQIKIQFDGLKEMEQDGLLQLNENSIVVLPEGKKFVRNICMAIDPYISENKELLFSKTI
jgi:oxygen-independent coproporphyrinogen-3 oxidase